jgi:hypothetical protein
VALPLNPSIQARIDAANAGIAGLASIYDPQRTALANQYAAQLNDQGYFRNIAPVATSNDMGTAYNLTPTADGRIYGETARSLNDQANAHGAYYSSWNVRQQQANRHALDAARNAILNQFAGAQSGITSQEQQANQGYVGDRTQAGGDYAQWQAEQTAPVPAAAAPATSAPAAAASTAPPKILNYYGFNPNTKTLDEHYGAGQYRVVKRGANAPANQQYVVIRA